MNPKSGLRGPSCTTVLALDIITRILGSIIWGSVIQCEENLGRGSVGLDSVDLRHERGVLDRPEHVVLFGIADQGPD
jgi:hypothetical protein